MRASVTVTRARTPSILSKHFVQPRADFVYSHFSLTPSRNQMFPAIISSGYLFFVASNSFSNILRACCRLIAITSLSNIEKCCIDSNGSDWRWPWPAFNLKNNRKQTATRLNCSSSCSEEERRVSDTKWSCCFTNIDNHRLIVCILTHVAKQRWFQLLLDEIKCWIIQNLNFK